MENLTLIILPVLIVIAFYLALQFIKNKKLFKLETFIKIRVLIGCIGAGVFLCLAYQGENASKIITLTLLAGTIIYGVISLMNKYLNLKD